MTITDAQVRSGVKVVDAAGSTLQRIAAQVGEMADQVVRFRLAAHPAMRAQPMGKAA